MIKGIRGRQVKFDREAVTIITENSKELILEFGCFQLPESAHKELNKVLKKEFKLDDMECEAVHGHMDKLLLRKLVNSAIIN